MRGALVGQNLQRRAGPDSKHISVKDAVLEAVQQKKEGQIRPYFISSRRPKI
jgi:hypothetical protein